MAGEVLAGDSPARTWRFNGRRGRYLSFKGVLYIIFGVGFLFPVATEGTERSLAFVVNLGIPVNLTGVPWVAVGIAALVGAFRSPPGRDGWAFVLLTMMSTAWAVVYFVGFFLGENPRGWWLGFVFVALAGGTYTVAGMVAVEDVRPIQDMQAVEALLREDSTDG